MNGEISAWCFDEFSTLDLKDERLNRRVVAVAAAAARQPHGRINVVFDDGAEKEAAYRLIENRRVDPAALVAACADAAVRRSDGDIIAILDQTSLSFADPHKIRGLGRVGADSRRKTARGIEVMTGYGVDKQGQVLGLLAQSWLVRDEEPAPPLKKDRRPSWERESVLWLQSMSTTVTNIRRTRPDARITFVADRGCDFYGALNAAKALRTDIIVRSAYNRRLVDGGYLHSVLAATKRKGVLKRKVRIRSGDSAAYIERNAKLELRYASVEIDLHTQKGSSRGTSQVTVVQVKERRSRGLVWTLLTTWPVRTPDEAAAVVDTYCRRWRIEDFHRTWKRGACDVEESQLRSVDAIKRWATILADVATRVERLKTLSRTEPGRPALDELSEDEIRALQLISGEPKHWPKDWSKITLGEAAVLIGYLGGWGGRSQGPPGSTILGRGLERVEAAAVVVKAMRERPPQM